MSKPKAGKAGKEDPNDRVPNKPDPLWPEGVQPGHLMPVDTKGGENSEVVDAAWKAVGADVHWRCAECGRPDRRSVKDPIFCDICYERRVTNTALSSKTNEGWMEQSEALGLAVYERQPEETDKEWLIWTKYREHYPLKMPTWTSLATECGCSVATVTRTAQRWSFKARMIAWARFIDGDNQQKRILAIREMNDRQLTMAKTIQGKLADAIDQIDPSLLRPGEIVNLFKVSTELERRINSQVEEKVESTAQDTKTVAKPKTKAEDLQEVMSILQQTGVIGAGPKVVGVEQKTTILVKEDS